MQIKLLASVGLGLSLLAAACVAPTSETSGDDTGGGGGGGGSGVVTGGWTSMPLPDDLDNPDRAVYHGGNDLVSGIYFESADKGFIVSQGRGETAARGGAVFTANSRGVTSIAFSGDNTGLGLSGSIDFTGLSRTANGYIAMAYANDVIASRDGGATFTIERNGTSGFGIEPVIGYRVTSAGTTLVRKTGVVDTTTSAPGSTATYSTIWAPNASPSMPSVVPSEQCQDGPLGTGSPTLPSSVHVAADRNFIAYTANPAFDPEICISTDGGHSFYPHSLGAPAATDELPATGVTFTSATVGIAWLGVATSGAYIKRTTDGGNTWSPVALPTEIASHAIELPAAFFAPDGQHGWIVGYDQTASGALLLATTDAGASWSTVSGVAAAVAAAGGDKLYSGFALDATHIWIGGARGLLLHN